MNNSPEKIRLFQIFAIALLFGFLTGYMLLFFIAAFILYITLILFQLSTVTHWIRANNMEEIPDIDGSFGSIVSHIIKLKKSLSDYRIRYKKLIARFNEILRSLPYPTIVINGNNEIIWISKSSAELLGLNRKKDVGLRINNIIRNEKFGVKLLSKDSNNQKILTQSKVLEIAISTLNKDTRILNIKDISSEYFADKEQKQFLVNASHEMRAPLTIISSYLETLQTQQSTQQSTQMAKKAYLETQKMSSMFDDLMQLTNIENQSTPIKQINIADVAIEVVEKLIQIYAIDNTAITVNKDDSIYVKAHYNQIYSLLFNILENAIKYSKKVIDIQVNITKINKKIILSIEDNGIGIAKDEIKKIVKSFYRTKFSRSSKIKGSGLGLAIVDLIVKKNSWDMKIHSTIDRGSAFTITLH